MKTFLSFIAVSILSASSFAQSPMEPYKAGPVNGQTSVSVHQSGLVQVDIEGEPAQLLFSSMQVESYKSSDSVIKESSFSTICKEKLNGEKPSTYHCRIYPELK